MKKLSFAVVLVSFLCSTAALNTWCCYEYANRARGWFRVFTTPATRAYAKRVCAAEGAKLATTDNDRSKIEMQRLAYNQNPRVAVHADVIALAHAGKNFTSTQIEDQFRAMTAEGFLINIKETDKFPFICFREHANTRLDECGLLELGYKVDQRTNSCYKFHPIVSVWSAANDTCSDEGAHLAVINSDLEAQIIKDLFAKYPEDKISVPDGINSGQFVRDYAFLGFGTKDRREWVTYDNKPIKQAGYDRFAPGEPNNARGDESCGSVDRKGLLVDEPCSRSQPFVCEKVKQADLCHDSRERAKCNLKLPRL